ncbi:uncharacterized protein LOC111086081 [Limulus polyphemus]|uniref:Uncharacterized protein LOC111086081 n=1 Tax=Limulus polyphemus TaxID=6850 RepID=A0ABM1SHZ8_LIMPO|nr:uncharacterized protein LOC111086081 [Limulus polyphemus]
MSSGCRTLSIGMHVILLLLWTQLDNTTGHPSRHSYLDNHAASSVSSLPEATSENVAYTLPVNSKQFLLNIFSSGLSDPYRGYEIPVGTEDFYDPGIYDEWERLSPEEASKLATYSDLFEVDVNDQKPYLSMSDEDSPFQDIVESAIAKRGSRPSLSIVSPLDVLSQRLRFEMARHWMKQSQKQIKENAALLRHLGKRDTTRLTFNLRETQRHHEALLGVPSDV